MAEITIKNLYDLSHTLAGDYLAGFTYPWEALAGISDMIVNGNLEPGATIHITLNENELAFS